MVLINHASAPIRKERLSSRRDARQNYIMEKGGMPDRVKSFQKNNSKEDRPKARPGFVKPIRNGLKKKHNLIKCRPFWEETGLAGRENGITCRFQKQE